jgi:hypothetical protein
VKKWLPHREFFERGAGKSFLPKKVFSVKNQKFLTQANSLIRFFFDTQGAKKKT